MKIGQVNKIKLIDPFLRLELLKKYMDRFIDLPPYKYTFGEFIHKYYPQTIPDTPEYYKEQATHCYYCKSKLVNGGTNFDHPKRSSIDHYEPKSKGKTDRYVICCAECNTNKGSTPPEDLARQIIRAGLKSRTMWGLSGEALQIIAGSIQGIVHDILFNTGPRVYYIKKGKRSVSNKH